ncbi:MAG: response regulator transcription factor [Chloroflexota bacterium]|nr:response regulator transcription factor [Chloroflexota bacterium]
MLSGNSDTHLRILLVDDHEVVRLGLRALLSRYPQFEVVAEAGDGDEALEKTLYYEPDVVVMDIRLPGKSGVEATEEIMRHRPETRVVMLTSYAEDDVLFDAIAAGAAGYVLKQIGSDDLVRALMTVGRGESLLDPAVTQKVFQKMRSNARQVEDEYFSMLTEQELTILALMTDGLTNKEIARRVFLSEKTVRNYVSSILNKLDVTSRAEAAVYAVRHHIEGYVRENMGEADDEASEQD